MRIIGVTGPSGSGKTLLGEYFSGLGIKVIDADALYHSMLVPPSECLDAIRRQFGDGVFCPDGSLDRAALSAVVFSDADKLCLLNETVLGIVISEIRRLIAQLGAQGETAVIVDAPTLIESGFDRECDEVISVISSRQTRIDRISARDAITRERAEERVRAQKDDAFYADASDYVLTNDGTEEQFLCRVRELGDKLGLNRHN